MTVTYLDRRGFPTWEDEVAYDRYIDEKAEQAYLDELEARHAATIEREPDYSGDRLLDGPPEEWIEFGEVDIGRLAAKVHFVHLVVARRPQSLDMHGSEGRIDEHRR